MMARVFRWGGIGGLLLILGLTGCADLAAVREYARQSAQLDGYAELTHRYRNTYQRERPYLFGEARERAAELDRRRSEVYADLIRLHTSVTTYMETLGKAAGEDSFSLSEPAGALLEPLAERPELGMNAELVRQYGKLAQLLTGWMTAVHQRHAVQEMIRQANAPLQAVLSGMERLVVIYEKTHENEQRIILDLLSMELAMADPDEQRLLVALGRAREQKLQQAYEQVKGQYPAVRETIQAVAEGHQSLYDNVTDLTAREVVSEIQTISKELKRLRKRWKSLAENRAG
jgi:hypothetical protein